VISEHLSAARTPHASSQDPQALLRAQYRPYVERMRDGDGVMRPTAWPLSPRMVTRVFREYADKAGLPETVRLHDLRHTAITNANRAGRGHHARRRVRRAREDEHHDGRLRAPDAQGGRRRRRGACVPSRRRPPTRWSAAEAEILRSASRRPRTLAGHRARGRGTGERHKAWRLQLRVPLLWTPGRGSSASSCSGVQSGEPGGRHACKNSNPRAVRTTSLVVASGCWCPLASVGVSLPV
jgi:hypothetical protein